DRRYAACASAFPPREVPRPPSIEAPLLFIPAVIPDRLNRAVPRRLPHLLLESCRQLPKAMTRRLQCQGTRGKDTAACSQQWAHQQVPSNNSRDESGMEEYDIIGGWRVKKNSLIYRKVSALASFRLCFPLALDSA